MKTLIAAGGTGGHFYPGLAVAKEFKKNGYDVAFIIRKADYVQSMLDQEGFSYSTISAAGFRRSFHPINILAIPKLILGFFESIGSLIKYRPDLLVALGGYLSVPPALAAKLLGIPIVLHEQNTVPGLANRVLASIATKIAVSFPQSLDLFGRKAVLTGNPVRPEFGTLPDRKSALQSFSLKDQKKTILIFGGSLGAHAINELVMNTLKAHPELSWKLQFVHFTGLKDESSVRADYQSMAFDFYTAGYCHDMVSAYAAADFVVCRAGASTISELITVKKPALLIPYPFATNDHQTSNSLVLSSAGAAYSIQEKDMNPVKLIELISTLIEQPEKLKELQSGYNRLDFSPLSAAEKIRAIGMSLLRT